MQSEEKSRFAHRQIESPIEKGLVFIRDDDSIFTTNVPFIHQTGGSPDGFETGYIGSGPSEFALNAVAWILDTYADQVDVYSEPVDPFVPADEDEVGAVSIRSGLVRKDAWLLRHGFKVRTIAAIKLENGERYDLPVGLCCAVLEIVAGELGLKAPPFKWDMIPGGRDQVVVDARAFNERFGIKA